MKKRINLLDLIQTAAIVFGICFGVVELQSLRSERAHQAALGLVTSFQNPEFVQGLALALETPEGASLDEVLEAYGGDVTLLNQTGGVFEAVGRLVWSGELDFWLVDEFLGGGAIIYWNRTRPYWEEWRERENRPSTAEWTQWLAERLEEVEETAGPPAHEAYRDWEPPKK